MPYVLYQETSSAFLVGLSAFLQFIPSLLLGPLAGSLADRFDRRRVLLVTQSSMAAAALVLWLAWTAGVRGPAAILALVAVSGVAAGANLPSWQAFVNDLVPRRDLLSAVTLNSLQFNAARAVGPAIAGVILATLGAGWAFFINALSFLCVLAALASIRSRHVRRTTALAGGSFRQFGRALTYVRRQEGILIALVIVVLVAAFGNPVSQFTVVFAAEVYHVGPLALGLLNVALGLGAVLAAPLVSGWESVTRAALERWAFLVYALAVIAFGLSPSYVPGVVSMVAVGGGFLVVVSLTNTSIQTIVADHMRGRVMAIRIMAFTGAFPIGAIVQGALSERIGPRATVTGAGFVLLAAAATFVFAPQLLLGLDSPHDERPEEAM